MFRVLRSLVRAGVAAVRRAVSWVADRVTALVERVVTPAADVVGALVEIHGSWLRTSPGYRAGLATILGRVLLVLPLPVVVTRVLWLGLVAWLETAAAGGGAQVDDGADW